MWTLPGCPEIADLLVAIHQCECHCYRYIAHVMQVAQQARRMKLAVVEMHSSTSHIVYDFKQKLQRDSKREVTPTVK